MIITITIIHLQMENLAKANKFLLDFKLPHDAERIVDSDDPVADTTTYLSWTYLKNGIRSIVKQIELRNYWVWFPKEVCSECVMTALVWDLLKEKPQGFIRDYHQKVTPGINIVIFDDWALTGQSTTWVIDNLLFENNVNINFHIVIPYMTTESITTIKSISPDAKIYSWSPRTIPQYEDGYHIFTDIKIADECCVPRQFYLDNVKPTPYNIKKDMEQFMF